jgi:hypothetical protein
MGTLVESGEHRLGRFRPIQSPNPCHLRLPCFGTEEPIYPRPQSTATTTALDAVKPPPRAWLRTCRSALSYRLRDGVGRCGGYGSEPDVWRGNRRRRRGSERSGNDIATA